MYIYVDTGNARFGDVSDLILIDIDEATRDELSLLSETQILDWIDREMENKESKSYYLTAMLAAGVLS